MQLGERDAPGSAAIIPPDHDGFPWVRLVTGLVALAMLAIPAGRHAKEWTTRPVADRAITAEALPPLPPIPPSREIGKAPLKAAAVAPRAEQATVQARSMLPSATHRKSLRAKATSHHWRRFAGTRQLARAYPRIARTGHRRTRTQVLREYMAAREQVAALTGEDSGSAWLMRRMERQRAARARGMR